MFPKKRLGQNFLVEKSILLSMVDAAAVCDRDIVLEIGTGAGSLTELLGERAGRVLSVEIDRDLFNLSRYALSTRDNIYPVNMDVLGSKTSIVCFRGAFGLPYINLESHNCKLNLS